MEMSRTLSGHVQVDARACLVPGQCLAKDRRRFVQSKVWVGRGPYGENILREARVASPSWQFPLPKSGQARLSGHACAGAKITRSEGRQGTGLSAGLLHGAN